AGVHEPSPGVSRVLIVTSSELGDTTRPGCQGDSDRVPSQSLPRADLQPVHPSCSDA
ncbi:Phosphomethylpyrimidine synthase, partial [Clarias magur]